MWALLEQAAKRAITPSGVAAEAKAALESLPKRAIDAALQEKSLLPLLDEDFYHDMVWQDGRIGYADMRATTRTVRSKE